MIAVRLQQTLNKRIELLQNLLLIYSYSELVTLKVSDYRKQNEKIHQKQITLIETLKNIFRIDQNFRRLFFNLACRTFVKLNSKFKPRIIKTHVGKIHSIYIQFMGFFKAVNEYQIVRFLSKVQLELVSQNQLFYILISILIKYLKSKTDVIIIKLRDKCCKESIDFYQEKSIKILEHQYKQQNKKKQFHKRRTNNFLRRKEQSSTIPLRKYHSQEASDKIPMSERQQSKQLSKSKNSSFQLSCKSLKMKGCNNIKWKIGIKKFQQIYFMEWQKYYNLLQPISDQLQQIKTKIRNIGLQQRKQWIYEHFNNIYQQALSRNQLILKNISSCRQKPNQRKSPIKTVQSFMLS